MMAPYTIIHTIMAPKRTWAFINFKIGIDLAFNQINNYIVKSYRDAMAVTKIATRRASKVMY